MESIIVLYLDGEIELGDIADDNESAKIILGNISHGQQYFPTLDNILPRFTISFSHGDIEDDNESAKTILGILHSKNL